MKIALMLHVLGVCMAVVVYRISRLRGMSVVGFGEVPEIKRKSYVVANLYIAITNCRDL